MNETRSPTSRWLTGKVALRAFLVAIAAGMGLGLLVILNVVTDTRFLFTAFAIAGACMLTFVQALVADHGRFERWMRAGMVAAWIAAAGLIAAIWVGDAIGWRNMEIPMRVVGAFGVAAGWCTWGGATLFARSGGALAAAVRWATFGVLTFGASCALLGLASPNLAEWIVNDLLGEQLVARVLAASVVLLLGGSIAQPVLIRLFSTEQGASTGRMGDRHVGVHVRCPRCAAESEIAANTAAACPSCRLLLRVQFEEPRCACGFLIYRLEGANCPECGRAVPDELRWRPDLTPSPASPPSP
jgi:hypothetical protein